MWWLNVLGAVAIAVATFIITWKVLDWLARDNPYERLLRFDAEREKFWRWCAETVPTIKTPEDADQFIEEGRRRHEELLKI